MDEEQISSSTDPEQQDKLWLEFVDRLRAEPVRPFQEHWNHFKKTFLHRREEDGPPLVWKPTREQIACSNVGRFMEELGFGSYAELHAWSVTHRAQFWEKVTRRLGIVFTRDPASTLDPSGGVKDPRWLPGAEMNCVESCFTASPDRPAVFSGREGSAEIEITTYGELERKANRVARGLREHGFGKEEAIALYMPMTVDCVAAYLGIIRAGCRVISIADSFSPGEVRKRLQIGEGRGIVTVDRFVRAGRTIGLYQKIMEAEAPRAIVIPAGDGEPVRLRQGDLLWDDLLSSDDTPESEAGDPYGTTNVLFSSGTTGTPKAIPWTHLTPIKCAMDGHFHQDIQPSDIVAWPTNIGWMMGPWLIYATLMNDATLALYEGAPVGKGFARFVQDARVTILGVVPSLVRAWRSSGDFENADWSHLRVFSSTGEPSNREDYLWLMSRAGYRAPIIEYCGGTEIGGGYITGTVLHPASPATFTTPALGMEVAVLAGDGGPVQVGRMGEVFLIPPSIGLSQKLLNGSHEDVYYDGCPKGPRGEVLRRHGDQMARLHGGFYRAQGRADDTMNLGGIKVSSVELERVLSTHEAVSESAAIAVQPEGEGAEKLVVYVVLKEEMDPKQLWKELASLIATQLNPLFKIRDLVVIDQLPRTASNKLMRRELRSRWAPST